MRQVLSRVAVLVVAASVLAGCEKTSPTTGAANSPPPRMKKPADIPGTKGAPQP